MPAVPADTNALADSPAFHPGADGVDISDDFVAGHAGKGQAMEQSALGHCVAVANTAGLHHDADLSRAGEREFRVR